MNPINEHLPTLLPLALPHLVTPRIIEAAAAYCVGIRGRSVMVMDLTELPPLDFKVVHCLGWHMVKGGDYHICNALLYSLELELDAIYGTSSATPP
jgi:hypothetical protein